MNWKTLIGNIEEKTGNNCDYKVAVPASWKKVQRFSQQG
jgi:hypothetical protein